MLADTETEVASLREVALAELVFLDLQSTLQDLFGLGTTDGDVNSDLFVTTDTEGSDGVAGLACGAVRYAVLESQRGEPYCRRGFDRSIARAP